MTAAYTLAALQNTLLGRRTARWRGFKEQGAVTLLHPMPIIAGSRCLNSPLSRRIAVLGRFRAPTGGVVCQLR